MSDELTVQIKASRLDRLANRLGNPACQFDADGLDDAKREIEQFRAELHEDLVGIDDEETRGRAARSIACADQALRDARQGEGVVLITGTREQLQAVSMTARASGFGVPQDPGELDRTTRAARSAIRGVATLVGAKVVTKPTKVITTSINATHTGPSLVRPVARARMSRTRRVVARVGARASPASRSDDSELPLTGRLRRALARLVEARR